MTNFISFVTVSYGIARRRWLVLFALFLGIGGRREDVRNLL